MSWNFKYTNVPNANVFSIRRKWVSLQKRELPIIAAQIKLHKLQGFNDGRQVRVMLK